jgi:RsiW-degrading membrane proteinase PrsW (M82 family)
MADTTTLLVLLVCAFVPPLLFLGLVRKTERYGLEPFGRVFRTFLWGAVFAVIIAVILSVILITVLQESRVYVLTGPDPRIELVFLALIIAPFTEEFAKGIGIFLARPMIDEPEDGIVYGAASGLGFAASENLLYGLAALAASGSLGVSILVIGVRSISSALLHASSSATFGYGIARNRLWPQKIKILPYYLLAVGMHAGFNLLASLSDLYTGPQGDLAALIGLVGAIALALIAFSLIRARIRKEDERHVAY